MVNSKQCATLHVAPLILALFAISPIPSIDGAFVRPPPCCDPNRDSNCPPVDSSNWKNPSRHLPIPFGRIGSGSFDDGDDVAGTLEAPSSPSSPSLSALSTEEQEYKIKLAEAERAVAEAQQARKKLALSRYDESNEQIIGGGSRSLSSPSSVSTKPLATRSTISYTDANSIVVTVPPIGLAANSVMPGVFSVAWFSAIIPATVAAGGIGSALFLLPFWLSGGLVAKLAFYDPFLGGELTIGRYAWSLKGTYIGMKRKEKDGATAELRGAVAEVAAVVNGIPNAELRLYGEKGVVSLGLGLPRDELEYLASEINCLLQETNDSGYGLYEGVL